MHTRIPTLSSVITARRETKPTDLDTEVLTSKRFMQIFINSLIQNQEVWKKCSECDSLEETEKEIPLPYGE